jgi:hypothetical protein
MNAIEPGPGRGRNYLRMTPADCRNRAQQCLEESRKALGRPAVCSAWLKLAEHWLDIAEESLTSRDL